jgi:hypothetical protein
MLTLLDIAKEDGQAAAQKSIAMRFLSQDKQQDVVSYFTRKRFAELYRDQIYRSRQRIPSLRECDLAYIEALKQEQDHASGATKQVSA